MARIFVKPAAGLSIPSPNHDGQALPAGGDWVDAGRYWTKRLRDGDVTDDTKAQAAAEADAEKKAAAEAKASKSAKPTKEGEQ